MSEHSVAHRWLKGMPKGTFLYTSIKHKTPNADYYVAFAIYDGFVEPINLTEHPHYTGHIGKGPAERARYKRRHNCGAKVEVEFARLAGIAVHNDPDWFNGICLC